MKFGISNLRFQIPNSRFQISNSKFGVSTAEIDMVVGDLLVWRGGGFLGVPRVALFRTFLLPLVDRVYIVRALDVRLKRIGWRTGIRSYRRPHQPQVMRPNSSHRLDETPA
jgi:hypothetical protein